MIVKAVCLHVEFFQPSRNLNLATSNADAGSVGDIVKAVARASAAGFVAVLTQETPYDSATVTANDYKIVSRVRDGEGGQRDSSIVAGFRIALTVIAVTGNVLHDIQVAVDGYVDNVDI